MTTKRPVVADDVLGKIARRKWDIDTRLHKGVINPYRVLSILKLAAEGMPEKPDSANYILESQWTENDKVHYEFATISLNEYDKHNPERHFEELLGGFISERDKEKLLETLEHLSSEQVRSVDWKMIRLYRIHTINGFGYKPSNRWNAGFLESEVDICFRLKPVCDFDEQGKAVPCAIGKIDMKV